MTRGRQAAVIVAMTAAGLAGACAGPAPEEATISPQSHVAAVEAWRAQHDADYRRDWVSISGLHFLDPGVTTAGSDPANDIVLPASTPAVLGRFVLTDGTVRFEPAPGAGVRIGDEPVSAALDLRDDSDPNADELLIGEVRVVVHLSGDNRTIRVRDPNGPLAKGFLGFSWFEIDPAYRVAGHFIPDAEPRQARVLNTFGDIDEYTTEGTVEFELQGRTLRLRPFTTRPGRLYFVFKDASSGLETYEAARFVYANLEEDGTAVIDFNEAYNPPCAFNPYTTCPIPFAENRLPIKILAGEKAYPDPPEL